MYSAMRLRGHNTGHMLEAMSGVDIALWDLAGKALGQPVYKLLGGPFRESIPVYASGVPGSTVEERVAVARRFVAEGFTAVKASMESWGVYWLEDPLCPEDLAGYAALTQALDVRVAAGETVCTRYQFRDWLERRAVDVILPDVCRAGGISEGRKIANLADTYGLPWCAHVSIGSSVHLAAALHLAAATPNCLVCEYPSTPNPIGDPLLKRPLAPEDGQIRLPEGPGLGIEFDEAALSAHRLD
jgi:L-alanine-DL-glutamate epimerase-like enolase superfamily enzyme